MTSTTPGPASPNRIDGRDLPAESVPSPSAPVPCPGQKRQTNPTCSPTSPGDPPSRHEPARPGGRIFDLRVSSFIRHSSLVIRHWASVPGTSYNVEG